MRKHYTCRDLTDKKKKKRKKGFGCTGRVFEPTIVTTQIRFGARNRCCFRYSKTVMSDVHMFSISSSDGMIGVFFFT